MTHREYELFAGLDVSMARTSLCLVDACGDLIWRGDGATDPRLLVAVIRRASAGRGTRIGLETRALSPWVAHGLRAQGFDVICDKTAQDINRLADQRIAEYRVGFLQAASNKPDRFKIRSGNPLLGT